MFDWLSFTGVFILGLQTAISPCPLTMNITAVAYLGRSQNIWLAGLLYAAGQIIAFWSAAVFVLGIPVFSGDQVTRFFALTLHAFLGPFLILIGMALSGLLRFPLPSWNGAATNKVAEWFGWWSPLPLGMMFALAFCPTTAAMFLAMLTLTAETMTLSKTILPLIMLPLIFALGTSLPILFFAGMLATQRKRLDQTLRFITGIERPARWGTGCVFILAGLWLSFWR
jgi:cytochrome c biogenesis protein CcdA